VAGRNRTCAAPRFRRALYPLSYGHTSGRGWSRTSDLLLVRQALGRAELLALELRDKGSNLGLHGQSVASCLLDDPGTNRVSPSVLGGRSTQRGFERALFSMPLAYPSTLDHGRGDLRTRPTWRGFGARARPVRLEKRRQKHTLMQGRLSARNAHRVFLSQAGPRVGIGFLKLSIILSSSILFASETTKATLLGRPRSEPSCR
jgi:hypothetical protein